MSLPAPPADLATDLLAWFDGARREMPWRGETDPYRIWVSEVMLQQTRVETVVGYWGEFIERFPDVEALAGADREEVLNAWAGLGYYRRARNLHRAAREVVERFDGRIPRDPEAFVSLPGVGPYTAGAVLSIAFDEPLPAIDGNVKRVVARLLALEDRVDRAAGRNAIEVGVLALHEAGPDRAGDLNQALMELGATVCLPDGPRCETCPWATACRGKAEGVAATLPNKGERTRERPVVERWVAAVELDDGLLVRRRPPEGLLAGMDELPGVDRPTDGTRADGLAALADHLRETLALETRPATPETEPLAAYRHVFSHLEWRVRAWRLEPLDGGPAALPAGTRPVSPEAVDDLALPTAMRPALEAALGG